MDEAGVELTVLPAMDGDCLILSYGAPRRHVVIDGGRGSTYKALRRHLLRMAEAGETLELLVVTHFDADHIEGILRLAADKELPLKPSQIWFNGYDQLGSLQAMNERQADDLTDLLHESELPPANAGFGGEAICLPSDGRPTTVALPGGLEITLLSPDRPRLDALFSQWERWRQTQEEAEEEEAAAGLQSMGHKRIPETVDVEELAGAGEDADDKVPNGSSIAFIARFGGRSALLAADAHPDLIERGIRSLLKDGAERLSFDLVKLSHHGSARNTTTSLLAAIDSTRFVVSTNGNAHNHPDPETIARILKAGPDRDRTLYFNYRQPWTELWERTDLQERYRYVCEFPSGVGGLTIEV